MGSPAIQCVVGCLLAIVGMMAGFGLVRLAANLLIAGLGLVALGAVIYCVLTGVWTGWPEVVLGGLGSGFAAALLSLPALPFSSLFGRGRRR